MSDRENILVQKDHSVKFNPNFSASSSGGGLSSHSFEEKTREQELPKLILTSSETEKGSNVLEGTPSSLI